jgi:hypothetical protein
MQPEKSLRTQTQRKSRKRKVTFILALIVTLIVSTVLLAPVIVSSERGRKMILAKINRAIDGQVNFTDLSLGWLKGIKVVDFSFDDGVGQTLVQVKELATKPHYGSILTGSWSFGETIIDEPKIEINLKDQLAKTTAPSSKPRPVGVEGVGIGLVADVVVKNGNLKVTDSKAKTLELSQINSRLSLRPSGKRSDFDIDMVVVEGDEASKIRASGHVKPTQAKTGWTLKGTTGDLAVEVNDLDLGSLAPIFELAKVDIQAKGRLSANLAGEIRDGNFENVKATVRAKNLDITAAQLKGDRLQTGSLNMGIRLNSKKDAINISTLQVKSDWANVNASGVVPTTLKSLADFLAPDSNYSLKGSLECDVASLLSQMPRTFGLKEGMKVTSGKLSGNVDTITRGGRTILAGQADLVGLAGTIEGKKLALSEPVIAELEIGTDNEKIAFDKFDVSAPFAKISASGNIEQIKYKGQADLAKLQSELGQFADIGPYQMTGDIFEQGTLSISEDRIAVIGSSQIKNLRLSSADGVSAAEPMADVAFTLGLDRPSTTLTIDSMTVNAGLGKLSVEDAIVPLNKKASKPLEVAASGSNIDLQKLQPFAVLFASFPQDMQLAGIAESQIHVASKNGTYEIKTDATKIKNFKLISPDKEPFQQEQVLLTFDAEVDLKEKAINVKTLELESPQIKIKKGEFKKTSKADKTKLQGRADCEYDWAAVGAVASQFMPEGLTLKGKHNLPIDFASEYPTGQTEKLLENLNTKGKLGFEEARYMGLNFGPTEAQIQIKDGLFTIEPFATTVNQGQFNFAGQADFKQEPTLLKTPRPMQIAKDIQISKETTEKLLKYVNPIFANIATVTGVANFNCERLAIPLASGNKNAIEIIGTISADKLYLQASDLLGQILSVVGTGSRGQELTIHPTRFVLQKGVLQYDDMQVDVGDNPINFKGAIGLDKSLNMTVTLPYTVEGRTARVGKETAGPRISLPLTGTIDKPQLDVAKLLEDQLMKQLEKQLRKGLEGLFR